MFILLIIELIYYIFVTFRINTDPNLLNPKDEERKDDSNDNNKEIKGIRILNQDLWETIISFITNTT